MLCSGLALRGSVWFTIRVTFLSSDTRNSLFQKGKSVTPPCKEQSFAPLVKGAGGIFSSVQKVLS